MTTLSSLFQTFLSNIRPTDQNKEDYIDGHTTLRDRLDDDEVIKEFYITDFLQGSYKRSTAVKPVGDESSDVDIILVTNHSTEVDPEDAMEKCEPFLEEHYPDQWEVNARSYHIEQDSVELDLVLTTAPGEVVENAIDSEDSLGDIPVDEALDLNQSRDVLDDLDYSTGQSSDDWKVDPLKIPDRRLDVWEETHPLYINAWTIDKGERTNEHYVNVVKAIKWWRRTQVDEPERPKGYPLEHIVGTCCPDGIESVAEGIVRTFEAIESNYSVHAASNTTPTLNDRGIPSNNVLARLDGDDFASFHDKVSEASSLARDAYEEDDPSDSRDLWHSLLGDEFPPYDGGSSNSDDDDDDDDDDGGDRVGRLRSGSNTTSVSDERFAVSTAEIYDE